jgi:small subunit ribosomal protein S2
VAERFNALVLKTKDFSGPWVRIPPSPKKTRGIVQLGRTLVFKIKYVGSNPTTFVFQFVVFVIFFSLILKFMLFSTKFVTFRLSFSQLVSLGVHIGHSFANSLIYSSWMIYAFRQELCLMNLYKFVYMFRMGFNFIDHSIFKGRPIWFANKDRSFDLYIRYFANKCGEFSSTLYWIRGMVSNFREIAKTYKKNFKISGLVKTGKFKLFDLNFKNWVLTRYTWPGVVFVSSVHSNYFVANEATSAGIPCLGIADTDAFSQSCTIAIPGNDDSIDCIIFYNGLVTEYILYRKFVYIFLWFLNIRRAKRLLSFEHWFSIKKSNGVLFSNFGSLFSRPFFRFNLHKLSLQLFFSRDSWFGNVYEQLTILKEKIIDFSISKVINFFESSQKRSSFFFRSFFFSHVWSPKNLFKRRRKFLRKRKSPFVFLRKILQIKFFSFKNFKYLYFFLGLRKKKALKKKLLVALHFYFLLFYFYYSSFTNVKKQAHFKVFGKFFKFDRNYKRNKYLNKKNKYFKNNRNFYGRNNKYIKNNNNRNFYGRNNKYFKNNRNFYGRNNKYFKNNRNFYGRNNKYIKNNNNRNFYGRNNKYIKNNNRDLFYSAPKNKYIKNNKSRVFKRTLAGSLKKIKVFRRNTFLYLNKKKKHKLLNKLKKIMLYSLLLGFFLPKKNKISLASPLFFLGKKFKTSFKLKKNKTFKKVFRLAVKKLSLLKKRQKFYSLNFFSKINNIKNKRRKLKMLSFFRRKQRHISIKLQKIRKVLHLFNSQGKKFSKSKHKHSAKLHFYNGNKNSLVVFGGRKPLSAVQVKQNKKIMNNFKAIAKMKFMQSVKPFKKPLPKSYNTAKFLRKQRRNRFQLAWKGLSFKFFVGFLSFNAIVGSYFWYRVNDFLIFKPFIFRFIQQYKRISYFNARVKEKKMRFFFWNLNFIAV